MNIAAVMPSNAKSLPPIGIAVVIVVFLIAVGIVLTARGSRRK